jgi:excisionase family DNA binding protein
LNEIIIHDKTRIITDASVFQGAQMTSYTVRQTADQLQVSTATIYGLCAQKRLPHIRIGTGRGTIRIRPDDLAAFVEGVAIRSPLPTATPAANPAPRKLKRLALS